MNLIARATLTEGELDRFIAAFRDDPEACPVHDDGEKVSLAARDKALWAVVDWLEELRLSYPNSVIAEAASRVQARLMIELEAEGIKRP